MIYPFPEEENTESMPKANLGVLGFTIKAGWSWLAGLFWTRPARKVAS